MTKNAVLVTGANGYTTQHVINKLSKRGCPTIELLNLLKRIR